MTNNENSYHIYIRSANKSFPVTKEEYDDFYRDINAYRMDLFERKNFLSGTSLGEIGANGTVQRGSVCNMEIWCECFGKDAASMKKADSYEIAAIMQKIGNWSKVGRETVPLYGRQRVYKRDR